MVCLAVREGLTSFTQLSEAELKTAAALGCEGQSAMGVAAREAYRKAVFRTDGSGLAALFGGSAPLPKLGNFCPLFTEAARVLRGLMKRDGQLPTKFLCEMLAPALRSYDAADDAMADAADELLAVARRRCDLVTDEQLERLEAANDHAEALSHLLDCVISEHEEQLDAQHDDLQLQALNTQAEELERRVLVLPEQSGVRDE